MYNREKLLHEQIIINIIFIWNIDVNTEGKKMFSKFKDGEKVIVYRGIGKKNGRFYYERKGIVICRDPHFKDYNIQFEDGTDDWFDEEYLRKRKEKKKNDNKKHKNGRI